MLATCTIAFVLTRARRGASASATLGSVGASRGDPGWWNASARSGARGPSPWERSGWPLRGGRVLGDVRAPHATLSRVRAEQLIPAIRPFVESAQVPGAVVGVRHRGETTVDSLGVT